MKHTYFYSNLLGLKNLEETEYKNNIKMFFQVMANDERKLLWLIETLLETTGETLHNTELEITKHRAFLPSDYRESEINKLQEIYIREKHNFIFLFSILQMLKFRSYDKFADEFNDFLKNRDKQNKQKKH